MRSCNGKLKCVLAQLRALNIEQGMEPRCVEPAMRLSGCKQTLHDVGQRHIGLGHLVLGGLPSDAVGDHRQLKIRHTLDARSDASGFLERIPHHGDRVDAFFF